MDELARISWTVDEPSRLKRERDAMTAHAPAMDWRDDLQYRMRPVVGWMGKAPVWGAERAKPAGVDQLLAGRQLDLIVLYPEGFPMVPPALIPLDPDVPIERRTQHRWHVNGDGSLCMVQRADDWQPTDSAADLVCKASGWFIEYLLLESERIDAMTECGISEDTSLDEVLAGLT